MHACCHMHMENFTCSLWQNVEPDSIQAVCRTQHAFCAWAHCTTEAAFAGLQERQDNCKKELQSLQGQMRGVNTMLQEIRRINVSDNIIPCATPQPCCACRQA